MKDEAVKHTDRDHPSFLFPYGQVTGLSTLRHCVGTTLSRRKLFEDSGPVSLLDHGVGVGVRTLAEWDGAMHLHPWFLRGPYDERRRRGELYAFSKSPSYEEPSVLDCLGEFDDQLKRAVLSMHRPPVTYSSLVLNVAKFGQRRLPFDASDPSFTFALHSLRTHLLKMGQCYLSSIEDIQSNIDPTSPGYPSGLRFSDKREASKCLTSPVLASFVRLRAEGRLPSVFTTFVRTQIQSRDREKVRAILAIDSLDQFLLEWVFMDFSNRFGSMVNSPGWPFSVGDSIFHGGAHASATQFLAESGSGALGDHSDISAWDGSLQPVVLEAVGQIMLDMVSTSQNNLGLSDRVIRSAVRESLRNISNGTVLTPWGEVMETRSGMMTGTYLTTTVNSGSNFVITAYAFHRRALRLSRAEFHLVSQTLRMGSDPGLWFRSVVLRISGDDNKRTMPAGLRQVFRPSDFLAGYSALGMMVKPGSSVDSDRLTDLTALEYNSRIYARVDGVYVTYRRADVLLSSLAYPERVPRGSMTDALHASRLLARCTAIYLEGFFNLKVRLFVEEFVSKFIPPATVIDWAHERSLKKRLRRCGLDELPMSFPSRSYAYFVVTGKESSEPFSHVEGSEAFPCSVWPDYSDLIFDGESL